MKAKHAIAALGCLLAVPALCRADALCFAPSTAGGVLRIEHCTPPGANYDEGWIGFSTTPEEVCLTGTDMCLIDGPTVFTISSSNTDPMITLDALPGGTSTLYLWLLCEHWGFLEAEFSLVGDFEVLSFTGMNGTTSSGTLPDLVVTAMGCLAAPTLLGSMEVRSGGATSAPVSAPSTWGQAKAGYAD